MDHKCAQWLAQRLIFKDFATLDYKTPIACHGDTIITVCTQFPHDYSKDQHQKKKKMKYQL